MEEDWQCSKERLATDPLVGAAVAPLPLLLLLRLPLNRIFLSLSSFCLLLSLPLCNAPTISKPKSCVIKQHPNRSTTQIPKHERVHKNVQKESRILHPQEIDKMLTREKQIKRTRSNELLSQETKRVGEGK